MLDSRTTVSGESMSVVSNKKAAKVSESKVVKISDETFLFYNHSISPSLS
jgi:hypothetical protein